MQINMTMSFVDEMATPTDFFFENENSVWCTSTPGSEQVVTPLGWLGKRQ
jgi:hypothetical protein